MTGDSWKLWISCWKWFLNFEEIGCGNLENKKSFCIQRNPEHQQLHKAGCEALLVLNSLFFVEILKWTDYCWRQWICNCMVDCLIGWFLSWRSNLANMGSLFWETKVDHQNSSSWTKLIWKWQAWFLVLFNCHICIQFTS